MTVTLHLRRRADASAEAYDVTLDDGLIVGAIRDRSAIAPREAPSWAWSIVCVTRMIGEPAHQLAGSAQTREAAMVALRQAFDAA